MQSALFVFEKMKSHANLFASFGQFKTMFYQLIHYFYYF